MSKSWDKRIAEIDGRIAEEGDEDFLSWPVIVGTMYVGRGRVVEKESREIGHLIPEGSDPNMIHQLYHLHKWRETTGLDTSDINSVVEIGGGYGSMYHLWRLLGFTGTYQMYDYPSIYKLQKKYCADKGIEPPELVRPPLKADLLIACFSLSEMDMDEREAVLQDSDFPHALIAFAPLWDGINNTHYFSFWGGTTLSSKHMKSGVYHFK